MKEIFFRILLCGLVFSLCGCFDGDKATDEVDQIQQYIQTTLKPKLQTLQDQLDLIETDPSLSSGGTGGGVANQRMSDLETQMTHALTTIQDQADRIFELEKQLAILNGTAPPSRTTIRSTAASTVSPPTTPVAAVSPVPPVRAVPTVEPVSKPAIRDDYFDSLVVRHYRETYSSASSFTNYQITLQLGLNFEAQDKLDQLNQMDPSFGEKYRQAKILSGRN